MAFNGHTVIDGDGHVIEDCQAIINYMPQPYRDGWIASMSDITERKRTEDEIAALNQQLARNLSVMTRLQTLSTRLMQPQEIDAMMENILAAAVEIAAADMRS